MRTIVLLLFFSISYGVYAADNPSRDFALSMNIGNFGGGLTFFADEYDFEFTVNMLNLFIEHESTHLGLMLSPFSYRANYPVDSRDWKQKFYFLNGMVYWNPLNIKKIILGPFASINYLRMDNFGNFNAQEYVFSSGLTFNWSTHIFDGTYPYRIIGSEVGYRNVSGKPGFYFNVNMDILVLAGLILVFAPGGAREANEEYEKQISGSGPYIPSNPPPDAGTDAEKEKERRRDRLEIPNR